MPTLHIAAVCLTDNTGRLLVVRKHNARFWMLPGGKADAGETPLATMQREVMEEVGIVLTEAMTRYLGHYEAIAANEPDHRVSAHVFYGRYDGDITPLAELAEAIWVHPADLAEDSTAPLLKEAVLPALMQKLTEDHQR
jgi:8-oxo-dGTP pyrophosphatase MutT (NUDIX family)